jgi:ABC-type multidrug transport system ATPase subunit
MELVISDVSKQYRGGTQALRNFTLRIGSGVLGLLGPNGAGKSTLMRILATVSRPTTGTILCNGIDLIRHPNDVRSFLGYLPQDFGVYPNLNVVEFLEYVAAAKGIPSRFSRKRIDDLLQLVNLVDVRKRPLGSFSGGMKQRVGIAQALLNDPTFLIVDEPTGGLDPEERVRFRNVLSDLSGERIVILSTHIVSDVEATATGIALIRGGSLQAHAKPEEYLKMASGKVWECTVPYDRFPALQQRYIICSALRRPEGVRVRLIHRDSPAEGAMPVTPTLEDAYLLSGSQHFSEIAA